MNPGTRWQFRKAALPSFPDLFFAVLLGVLFGRAGGLEVLLADGDTGWHIRTGEWILRSGTVPRQDLFSFSRAGAPWMAWEWLSDVLFARLYAWHGLTAVAGACAVALCLAATLLLAWLMERGAGLWVVVGTTLAASIASTIHFLARPHVFSILLFTASLWMVDRDRRKRTGMIWWLAPLTALWCNLHAGFTVWLAVSWLLVASAAIGRDRAACGRYGRLAALCSVATLFNPYGWKLHCHIAEYLASSWILNHVQEFQPPQIRSENMLVFALALVAGIALADRSVRRGEWFQPLLVWSLGLAALRSARHVPLFAVAASPLIAGEAAQWWSEAAASRGARSAVRILWEAGERLGRLGAVTVWTPVLGAMTFWALVPPAADFPRAHFPSQAVAAMKNVLAPGTRMPRILTSDQWADYLIFRLYPSQRVFFDGRSDFYGEALGMDYQALLDASPDAREVLARYRFDLALLPHDWPLERVLETDSGWDRIYRDPVSALFVRRPVPPPGGPSQCQSAGLKKTAELPKRLASGSHETDRMAGAGGWEISGADRPAFSNRSGAEPFLGPAGFFGFLPPGWWRAGGGGVFEEPESAGGRESPFGAGRDHNPGGGARAGGAGGPFP